ncbi:phage tail protein [Sphingomonas naphthae]|uniref:Phage tail protein n=1 Tax=Sphingomonas naphthae TaxID=1813468 RepID=A0ABY7TKC5_9SPHN|nr:phage tail protein [Sphingomonas naphthae]WCT73683.1 phage tail protein [Sphingomonas naphthae]
MATLVLTAAGSAVGGPIGGAIGALVGQQVDRRVLGGGRREGARLTDLKVQTSAYGIPLPKLFGTLRVAGTVIWATELQETRESVGGGKAGGKATAYSYSASFAVALSARPIRAVHRIWADGKLLRGAAGDWKSETGFRLYLGGEDQAADPLIAAVEGVDACPAHRGIAYAVFEHLALADYGNRIPSLTFEVEADAAPVTVGAVAAALAGEGVAGEGGEALAGYAASGDSVRGAIEALAAACPVSVVDDGAVLRLAAAAGAPVAIGEEELGVGEARRAIERVAAGSLPDEVAIFYYDPARDYQAGLQRARRGGPALRGRRIELAAALAAGDARRLAEAGLARAWTERTTATLRLPWHRLALGPGMRLSLPGDDGVWAVRGTTIDAGAVELALVRAVEGVAATPPAVAGRAAGAPDGVAGATILHLLDLPPIEGAADATPRLWLAAAGGAGWRRAVVSLSLDGGASWSAIGETAAPAVLGVAVSALGEGDPALFDCANSVEIDLAHEGMALAGASDAALIGGANSAMLGEELIQFGEAVQIGPRRWRIGRLLRGRRGSEAAVAGHAVGDRFTLIESGALLPIPLSAAAIGTMVRVQAIGIGDAEPVVAEAILGARAVRPPSPVHPRAIDRGGDVLRIGWTRRSRTGWAWIDGADAPLGEEAEAYRLEIAVGGAVVRAIDTAAPWFNYGPAERAADGASGSIAITVRQAGAVAPSDPPLRANIHIGEIMG